MTSIASLRQRTGDNLVKRGMAALEELRTEFSVQQLPTTETIVRLAEHLAAEAVPIAKLRIKPKTTRKFFGQYLKSASLAYPPILICLTPWSGHRKTGWN